MNMEKQKAKIEKIEKSLQPLLEKKKVIDEKVKAKQAEIAALKNEVSIAEFREFQSKLQEKGIDIEAVKTAIDTQDFSKLK